MQNEQEFTNYLIDKYGQKPCFVLSAGPSLGEVDTVKWRKIMKSCLVISIKQAVTLFPEETDVLLTNDYNLIDYSALSERKNWIHIHLGEIRVEADANYRLDPERKGLISSVSSIRDFSRNSLRKESIASGPGIMYELAFPLLVDLKIKRCIVAGWDMTPAKTGHNEHFYKKSHARIWRVHDILKGATGKKSAVYKAAKIIMGKKNADKTSYLMRQKLYDWAAFVSTGRKWKSIGKDTKFNSEKINSEMDLSRDVSGVWHDYLESQGVKICIVSSLSTADRKIIRITSPLDAMKFLGL